MVQGIRDESGERSEQRKLEIHDAQDALLPNAGCRGGVGASKHLASNTLVNSTVNQRGSFEMGGLTEMRPGTGTCRGFSIFIDYLARHVTGQDSECHCLHHLHPQWVLLFLSYLILWCIV
jgi:hypothetical protein